MRTDATIPFPFMDEACILRNWPRLTPSEAYVFSKHHREGMSLQQIADEWGRSKATVQTFLTRARRKLERA